MELKNPKIACYRFLHLKMKKLALFAPFYVIEKMTMGPLFQDRKVLKIQFSL
jgi:hypothetical protein